MGIQPDLQSVLERLATAMNRHDLEALVDCFDPDYQSEQPLHPDRGFAGREQVRKNWSAIFQSTPDLRADLLRTSIAGDTVWAEWRWSGLRVDGTRLDLRGVTIFGVRNDRMTWARLYMEPVEEAGAGIDASVRNLTHTSQPEG